MLKLEDRYVWELPVRATHWVNMLSIIVLAVTGICIGTPKTLALMASEYVMGWIRFVHFVTGYVFATSVVARIYWSIVGNRYASWREFVPFLTPEGRRHMGETFRYYTFLSRTPPHVIGHNALAGATYLLVFALYGVMVVTGFSLYGQYAPGGFISRSTRWLFYAFSNQGVRLTHHLTMWFLIAFAIHHVYSAWLMDIKEKGGVISSIFGGYKGVRIKG
jgi:Ni/Fe-hydrogenase 1 B-type cytochrome subunit